MYCPECRVEYRDGFTECSDCHVPLVSGTCPPDPPDPFDPNLDLVVVLETDSRVELAMAEGLLEQAGIPHYALGQITTLINDIDPFLHKLERLQVPRDREDEARELLAELAEPVAADGGDEMEG